MNRQVWNKRRAAPAAGILLIVVLGTSCGKPATGYWSHDPAVSVVGAVDRRAQLVDEAVTFWNQALADAGSSLRLGPVSAGSATVPDAILPPMGAPFEELARELQQLPGDIVVVLSNADVISFATLAPTQEKAIIVIRGGGTAPLILPNVARNVIAQSLGHALGLENNDDATTLMCGRPAPCRPIDFLSLKGEYFFPLLDSEKQRLAAMYPGGRPGR